MKKTVNKQNLKTEFYMSEKCYITELSNSADDPDVSIARARVEPGVTTRSHRLKGITERYFIISGRGAVEIGGTAAPGSQPRRYSLDSALMSAAHYQHRQKRFDFSGHLLAALYAGCV